MRLLSIRAAADEARRTLRRFPFVLGAAAAAAVASSVLVSRSGHSEGWEALLAAATLGLPLFVVLALTAERLAQRKASVLLHALGLAVLVLVGLAWPHWSEAIQVRRYAQFSIGFHLLVAFLPYARRGESNGFWQYNRTLFLRFLTSALHSAVLYTGLVIAIVAINQLFKVRISEKTYLYLWIAIAFLFNTWFFLGGMPAELAALDRRRDYPRGLKVFSQFILIPLVVVYLAILTTYLGRVLLTGQWPSGWIGYLVSSVATVGILSLLLVHPIRELEENRWVATYARWFYVAMLPAIGMLLAAIGKRIGQYGVTEDRYFIAILAVWLAAIAAYYIARRNGDIRWIPLTLCVVAFATAFGPWSAYGVSRGSQISHLRRVLAAQGLVVNGATRPATAAVPFEARREIGSTLNYLYETHGERSVVPVLGEAIATADTDTTARWSYGRGGIRAAAAMRRLGLDYVNPWESSASADFWYNPARVATEVIPIAGDDFHVHLQGSVPDSFLVEGDTWRVRMGVRGHALTIGPSGAPPLEFPIDSLVAIARGIHPWGAMGPLPSFVSEGPGAHGRLVPRSLHGTMRDDTLAALTLDADLYLALKRPSPAP